MSFNHINSLRLQSDHLLIPGLIRGSLSLLCKCSFLLTNEATAKRIEGFQMVGKLLTERTQLDYGLSSFNCSHWVKS